MIKDIVVNLGLGAHDPAGDYAITVANAFEAHVLGVAFAYEPVIPGTVMGGIPPEFIESQRVELEKKASAATARFEAAAKRAGISAESLIMSASVSGAADRLGRLARRFDLVVAGQAEGEKSVADEVVDEGVLFESGRPVIFVPFIQKAGLKLDRVMVCWDGSRAATRAVADSMPFLHKAKRVEIVMVAGKAGKNDEDSRHRSRPASRPPWAEGRRQTHHLAGYRYHLDDPVLCGRYQRRHDRDGRLRPFAPARIHSRRRHPRHPRNHDRAGVDVALADHTGVHSKPSPPMRGRPQRGIALQTRHVKLLDGAPVLLRPLTVADGALYPDFLAEVTADDLRLRFFAAMREVAPEMIDKLIHYDPAHAMAFIAIEEQTGRMLGVVRLHDDPSGDSAEFAILVRSRLKGHGLGWLMMKHMIACAKDKGLKTVHGQVLTENATMLLMCSELGFHSADDPTERSMKVVTLPLAEVPCEAVH